MKEYTFIRSDPTLQNNLMAFGFECGEGWYPLIIECFDELQEIVDNNPEFENFEIVQVKEKYGQLTIYSGYSWDIFDDILDEYMEKSLHVCEWCGTLENVDMKVWHGWYSTLCDNCFEKNKI